MDKINCKLLLRMSIILLLICGFVVSINAQNGNEVLTNAKVIEMVKAGLTEETVILAIRQSAANFDTSAQALIQLKKQGISANIINEMLQAGAKDQTKTDNKEPENLNIFYFQDDSGKLTELERISGQAQQTVGANGYFLLKGSSSSFRLESNQKQNFIIRLPKGISPDKIDLFRMFLKDGKRAVPIFASGNFAYPVEAKTSNSPGKFRINISNFGESSYKISPAQNLIAGEYCLSTPNEASNEVFCFGINGNSNVSNENTADKDTEVNFVDGVVLIDGTNRITMQYSVIKVESSGNAFSGIKGKVVLNGEKSKLRIKNNIPNFLLLIPQNVNPDDYVVLAKLESKKDKREAQLLKATGGVLGIGAKVKSGIPKKSLMPIAIKEIENNAGISGYKLYQIDLVSPLLPDEYALVVLGETFYDFGVD